MTLLEMMIVVALLGILITIVYPAYTGYVLQSYRHQALADMMKIQLRLEQEYSGRYQPENIIIQGKCLLLCDSDPSRYTFSIELDEPGYQIIAIPQPASGQDQDQCQGQSYRRLLLKSSGEMLPAACWK